MLRKITHVADIIFLLGLAGLGQPAIGINNFFLAVKVYMGHSRDVE